MYNNDEHETILKNIANAIQSEKIDIASVTQELDKLRTNYTESIQFEENCTSLKNDNEKLRSANMKLFLKIGDSNKNKEPPINQNNQNNKSQIQTIHNGLDCLADEFLGKKE